MTTYKDAGVDTEAGGSASAAAYRHAASTFHGRKGMIGEPVMDEGGFAGMIDMGDYYLVQGDDSTGTKIDLACAMKKYNTIGEDLLCMVADDLICVGAEVVSVMNTLDVPKIDESMVDQLMGGLALACQQQKIVIPGGEIAEVPGAVEHGVWSATATGVVAKDSVLKPETIGDGDAIVALKSRVARSNGFSLIRKILSKELGDKWYNKKWKEGLSWGEVMLTPSLIYHGALLDALGRYGEERKIKIKGIAHVTGGGIPENLARVLKKSGCGAVLSELWEPHASITDVIELGKVPIEDAYGTWNMGNGMLVIMDASDVDEFGSLMKAQNIKAKQAGRVTKHKEIQITSCTEQQLNFAL